MLVSFIFMELFAWLLVGFALYGALLNSNGQALRSYKVWLFSNAGFVAYNAVIGSYAQCALFSPISSLLSTATIAQAARQNA